MAWKWNAETCCIAATLIAYLCMRNETYIGPKKFEEEAWIAQAVLEIFEIVEID